MSAPWMPLYVADYLADTGHLSTTEHGAYMLLIMHYWRQGGLPSDEKVLARIARMTDREWRGSRVTIAAFFSSDWKHARIEIELEKSREKSSKRAEAGSRGGFAKALKSKDTPLANATILPEQKPALALASSSQPQSQSEEEKKNSLSEKISDEEGEGDSEKPKKRKLVYSEGYLEFWKLYPTDAVMSKKEGFAAWKNLDPDDRALAMRGIPALIEHKRKNPDYRMVHACRYLSQRRFDGLAAPAEATPDTPLFATTEDWFANLRARRSVAGAN